MNTHRTGPTAIKQQFFSLRVGPKAQVWAIHRWAEKGFGCIPSQAMPLVDLKIGNALVVTRVEVTDLWDPDLLAGIGKGFQDIPLQPLSRDMPLAATAMVLRLAVKVVLALAEVGQHVVPAPASIPHLLPTVIIVGLPTHINHAVNRGTAAQHLPARIGQRPAIEAGIGLGSVAPVHSRIAHVVKVAHRHVDPESTVAATRFDQ